MVNSTKKFDFAQLGNMAILKFVGHKIKATKAVHVIGKRRAVSEVIATVLLLAITVVGAVMVSAYFQNTHVTDIGAQFNANSLQSQSPASIQITGYDTRDGINLSNISGLNNFFDSKLCTKSCSPPTVSSADAFPAQSNGGTEFITIKIKNYGTGSILIKDVIINGIDHTWDKNGAGTLLSPPSTNFPTNGKFWITSTTDQSILASNSLASNDEIRLIIKLSKDLIVNNGDIPLNFPLSIQITTANANPPKFVILSGDVM